MEGPGDKESAVQCRSCGTTLRATARFCDNCGQKVADLWATPIGAPTPEMRSLTVLFADLKAFSSMSENLDPDDVHDVIRRVFAVTDECVEQVDGHVEKRMGDTVMALFGYPHAHEDDPARAIRAALRIQTGVSELSAQVEAEGFPRIQLRVGINTGRVLIAHVGRRGSERSVYGDAVNVAARVEAACPPGSVLVSHETYRHVRGLFEVSPLPPIQVKGKSQPLSAYEVQHQKSSHLYIGTKEVLGVESAMVGRDVEVGQIQDAFRLTREQKKARLIHVIASPGMGKTRVLHEFLKRVEAQQARAFLMRARATTETVRQPYHLLSAMLKGSVGISEDLTGAEARSRLSDYMHTKLGGRSEVELVYTTPPYPKAYREEAAHFVAELIGIGYPDSRFINSAGGDPQQIRTRAFLALIRLFSRRAEVAPLVLELEDLHWADSASLVFFEYALKQLEDRAFMVLAASRPEVSSRHPDFGKDVARAIELRMAPLSNDAIVDLVEHLLRNVGNVPQRVVAEIAQRAGGIPYFAEEMVKSLADLGTLVRRDDQWFFDLTNRQAIDVPASVEGVLQARLDRLTPLELATARIAGVVGRVFWDSSLIELCRTASTSKLLACPNNENEVRASLQRLCDRELIRVHPVSAFPGALEYSFVHDLTRDVAYNGLVKRARRQLHTQLAEWLEANIGDRAREWFATIAGHYEAGRDHKHAAEWYLRAAQSAAGAYSNTQALELFEKAIGLGTLDHAQRARARLALAQVRERVGQWQEALAELGYATTEAETARMDALRAEILTLRAKLFTLTGQFDAGRSEIERAIEISRRSRARKQEARALSELGYGLRRRGELEAAMDTFREALTIHRSLRDARGASDMLLHVASVYMAKDLDDQALNNAQKAKTAIAKLQDPARLAHCLHTLGYLNHHRGNADDAIALYQESLDLRISVGDRPRAAWNLHNIGQIRIDRGDIGQAADLLTEEREISESVGNRPGVAYGLMNHGTLETFKGHWEKAIALNKEALEIFEEVGELPMQGTVLDLLADLYRSSGDLDNAKKINDEAAQIKSKAGEQEESVGGLLIGASIAAQRGELERAQEILTKAEAAARPGRVPMRVHTLVDLAEHADRQGRSDECFQWAVKALAELETVQDPLPARALHCRALIAKQTEIPALELVKIAEQGRRIGSVRDDARIRIAVLQALLQANDRPALARFAELPQRPWDAAHADILATLMAEIPA